MRNLSSSVIALTGVDGAAALTTGLGVVRGVVTAGAAVEGVETVAGTG